MAEVRKYDFIDALRGYAIAGVVLVHTSQWIRPESDWFSLVASQGARGVQLFFVASAVTLFLSMAVRRGGERQPILSFAIRRFFRIAPMFYAAMAVYLVYYGFGPRYWAPEGVEAWYFPLTLLFLHGWHPETISSVVPGGWSIAVEMTFYACVPFLFSRLTTIKRTTFALLASLVLSWILSSAVMALLTPHYPPDQHYVVEGFTFFWFFSQLPVFLLGILLYHLMKRLRDCEDKQMGLLLIVSAAFLWVALLNVETYHDVLPLHVLYGFSFLVFGLGLFLYPTQWLVNPVSRWLGRISFSVYLTHFGVIFILRDFLIGDDRFHGDGYLMAGFLLVLVSASVISYGTHRYVEQPGIALGKRLIKRMNGEPLKSREPQSQNLAAQTS